MFCARDRHRRPRRHLAGGILRWLQLTAMEWLDEHRMTVIEVPVRIGLFGLGVAFVHALGVDSTIVRTLIAGLALKRAPKKQPRQKKQHGRHAR